jgi:hypothetical protein
MRRFVMRAVQIFVRVRLRHNSFTQFASHVHTEIVQSEIASDLHQLVLHVRQRTALIANNFFDSERPYCKLPPGRAAPGVIGDSALQ